MFKQLLNTTNKNKHSLTHLQQVNNFLNLLNDAVNVLKGRLLGSYNTMNQTTPRLHLHHHHQKLKIHQSLADLQAISPQVNLQHHQEKKKKKMTPIILNQMMIMMKHNLKTNLMMNILKKNHKNLHQIDLFI